MHRTSRLGLRAGILATALVLGLGGAATADDQATIAHVETTSKGLQVLVSVPADTEVDLSGVSATIDGTVATATAAPAASTTDVRRTAVLAIDTSSSMQGARFAAAKAAAETFLETVPDDVYVGIVQFSDQVVATLPPTQDRERARAIVEGLQLSRQTRLYDGILAGLDMAGTEGQRTLVVLSDGADTSDTPVADVTSALSDADVLVDVVALDQSGAAVTSLRRLADAGSGEVIQADPAALRRTFTSEAAVLARQVLVTVQVPDSVTASDATLAVTLPTDGGSLTAQAFTTIQQAPHPAAGATPAAPAAADRQWTAPPWAMYAGIGAVGFGLLVLLVLLVPSSRPPRMTAEDRVSTYTHRLEPGILLDRTAGRQRPGARPGHRGRGPGAAPQQVARGPDRPPPRGGRE